MSMEPSSAWRNLLRQWSANMRLRAGVWLVLGLCWVYAWLVVNDWTHATEAQRQLAVKEIQALEPVKRSAKEWSRRESEVFEARGRLQALSWAGSERGIIEANVQDWLRAATARAKLNLREVRVLPDAATVSAGVMGLPEGAAGSGVSPHSSAMLPQPLRFRLVVEFRRLEAMALLVDMAKYEPLIAVDRLQFRTQSQPAVLELELRVLGWERRAVP
jgi:hypothetical protein